MAELDLSQYTVPNDTDVLLLDCKTAFNGLTTKEKLYAHYLGRASWEGSLICLLQLSPESPGIFLLFQRLFGAESVEDLKKRAVAADIGVTEEEFQVSFVNNVKFLQYYYCYYELFYSMWVGGWGVTCTYFEARL